MEQHSADTAAVVGKAGDTALAVEAVGNKQVMDLVVYSESHQVVEQSTSKAPSLAEVVEDGSMRWRDRSLVDQVQCGHQSLFPGGWK